MQDYVAVTKVVPGDTIMVLLYPNYPVYPETNVRNGTTSWKVRTKTPRRAYSWHSSMFGGTVRSNDTSTGIFVIDGSPNSLEGIHHVLKPGAGSNDFSGQNHRTGLLELPYPFIQRAFIIIPHPTHPGEIPTPQVQKHPPYFFKYVRLDRRY